ncbi:MAG: CpsD/CapB family tyrosine-protein kinase [Candidatus Omnitrophota bacterium]|nr:CpsD/CapB family tyrosine-protein kinase [Candidatus Omnitrophota bacterium]
MKDMIAKIMASGIKNINIRDLAGDILAKIRGKEKKAVSNLRPEFILCTDPRSPVSEAYRMLRTNIQYLGTTRKTKSMLVTSSGPREGKTTTVINLGCAFAQAGKKTLIIDSDLRNPSFHRLFKINNGVGFSSIILGQKKIDEAVQKNSLIPNLDILTSGPRVKNPSEMIGSRGVPNIINAMNAIYDIVIFDSPPILAVTDAQLLAFNVDGVILVVQCGKVAREVALKAKQNLEDVKANIIGVILNNLDISKGSYYYYNKYYYSYYAKAKSLIEQPPEAEIAEQEIRFDRIAVPAGIKKSLFIPSSSDAGVVEVSARPNSKDNIITMLSKEEKAETGRIKAPVDKNSALGRKTVFFEESEKGLSKEERPDRQNKDKGGLGKKDIFKDLR